VDLVRLFGAANVTDGEATIGDTGPIPSAATASPTYRSVMGDREFLSSLPALQKPDPGSPESNFPSATRRVADSIYFGKPVCPSSLMLAVRLESTTLTAVSVTKSGIEPDVEGV
jgi:hypothetical protein